MAAPVDICNLALGWLGEHLITQLNENNPLSTDEQLCARLYPEAVRSVLEAKAWTFATERLSLAPAASTGRDDFPSKYPLPATVVRVLSVDTGYGENECEWRREGAQVLTDASPTTLAVKALVEPDPTKFSPGFVRAVAARLAADLAIPVTSNAGLQRAMEAKYLRELALAGRLDGQQGSGERAKSSYCASRRW